MREEFEKLPEIAESVKDGEVYFDEKEGCYIATDVEFYYDAGYANGAWYAFQEQQTKINAVLQYLDTGDHPLDFSANTIRELLR